MADFLECCVQVRAGLQGWSLALGGGWRLGKNSPDYACGPGNSSVLHPKARYLAGLDHSGDLLGHLFRGFLRRQLLEKDLRYVAQDDILDAACAHR